MDFDEPVDEDATHPGGELGLPGLHVGLPKDQALFRLTEAEVNVLNDASWGELRVSRVAVVHREASFGRTRSRDTLSPGTAHLGRDADHGLLLHHVPEHDF